MQKLYVPASDLAAVCSMNPYKTPKEMLLGLWKTNAPQLYHRLSVVDEEGARSWRSRAARLVGSDDIRAAVASEASFESTVKSLREKATSGEDLAAFVSAVYTQRGSRDEKVGLDRYEVASSRPVTHRNAKVHSWTLNAPCGIAFVVRGRVDGMQGGAVVEHKQRQKRLFGAVPLYEKVQCHAYMAMTDASECRLVETFGDATMDHVVAFDPELWAQVKESLNVFGEQWQLFDFAAEFGTVDEAVAAFLGTPPE